MLINKTVYNRIIKKLKQANPENISYIKKRIIRELEKSELFKDNNQSIKYYVLIDKNNNKFNKTFISENEARHFAINHLDLSLNWSIKPVTEANYNNAATFKREAAKIKKYKY